MSVLGPDYNAEVLALDISRPKTRTYKMQEFTKD